MVEALGALGIKPGLLVSQIVNFALLVVILRLLLYRPLLRVMEERRAKIAKGLEDAEKAEKAASEAQAEYERIVNEARREGQQIIAQATRQSERQREEILERAREEARELVEKAREDIERERRQAMAELRGQVADLSVLISQKVIGKALDEQKHRQLVGEFLEAEGI